MLNRILDRWKKLWVVGNSVEVRRGDRWIVSFPKSGNTWVRFMVACALVGSEEGVTLETMDRLVPDIYATTRRRLDKLPDPRILKSHETFNPGYRRVVYLVRNPLDAYYSYFHHLRRVGSIDGSQSFGEFLEGQISRGGTYGTWAQHVGSWVGARGDDPEFLLVRYEDIVQAPEDRLASILAHLGVEVEDRFVARVVLASSIDRLRALELAERKRWGPARQTRSSGFFFRSGRIGEGVGTVDEAIWEQLPDSWMRWMRRLGYEDV